MVGSMAEVGSMEVGSTAVVAAKTGLQDPGNHSAVEDLMGGRREMEWVDLFKMRNTGHTEEVEAASEATGWLVLRFG